MSVSNTSWFGTSPLTTGTEQKASLHIAADGVYTITRRWVATAATLHLQQTAIRASMPALSGQFITFGSSVNALCISSDIDPVEGKAELYMLTEVYQGYVALPFIIYSWQTARLDRPIQMHPNFDGQNPTYPNAMKNGVNWAPDPQTGLFAGFPPYNIGGTTANPYRGIDSWPTPTGVWKKTSFTVNAPTLTGNLWKGNPPDVGTFTSIGLPDLANNGPTGTSGLYTWIKSLEDFQNLYRGASNLWQLDEAWWANINVGWKKDIFTY